MGGVEGCSCGCGRMAAGVGGAGRLQLLEGQKAEVMGEAGWLQLLEQEKAAGVGGAG